MKKLLLVLIAFTLIVSPLQAGGNRWTSKPPIGSSINWEHPLSKGIVGCWLMNEGGGKKIRNLTGRNNANLNSGGWSLSQKGYALVNDYAVVEKTNTTDTSVFDFLDKRLTIVSGVIEIPFNYNAYDCARMGANYSGYRFTIEPYGGMGLLSRDSAGNQVSFDSYQTGHNTVADGKYHILVGVWNNTTMSAYLDGKFKYTADISSLGAWSFTSGSEGTVELNLRRISNGSASATGKFLFWYFYNRALSPQEIQQLYIDPYCFINPPTIWSKFKTAVAAGVIKTLNGLPWASVKTKNGVAVGNVKTINGAASQ
jgi:hypothetical protein